TRVRDKQQEMVRVARDLVEISSEIITEKFSDVTMIEMSQTQLPTTEMVDDAIRQVEDQLQQYVQQVDAQIQQARQQPQIAPPQSRATPGAAAGVRAAGAGAPPGAAAGGAAPGPGGSTPPDPVQALIQQAQQTIQQGQQQIQKLQAEVTIDQVLHFLRDSRAKSFTLDIETDSTIMADEDGEKQRRTEFVGVLSQLLPQLTQMLTGAPETAPFCGEVLKFATAPFRAGRSLDGAIDDLIELMKQKSGQQQPDDPQTAAGKIALQVEQLKQQTAMAKLQQDMQIEQAKLKQAD